MTIEAIIYHNSDLFIFKYRRVNKIFRNLSIFTMFYYFNIYKQKHILDIPEN